MFSGIVETLGCIALREDNPSGTRLQIAPKKPWPDLEIGESIAVNGACLTLTHFTDKVFGVTVVPETLRLTNLGGLLEGCLVNLERSLTPTTRISGHFVQGHVECVGKILDIKLDGTEAWLVKIGLPATLSKYVVKKGFIALDGMSITVVDVAPEWFTVTLIPHTQHATIAQYYQRGSLINIETDIYGRYIESLS